MGVVEYKTEQEVQKLGMDVLYKELGASDFIRFMQQFNQGYGNYTEDRQKWQQSYSVDDVLAEINNE